MAEYTEMIIEFDKEHRILTISATEKISSLDEQELCSFCDEVKTLIEKYATSERCYLAVDLGKIVVDPKITSVYADQIKGLSEKYLYPNGLARYGFGITRLTAMKASHDTNEDPKLFRHKQDALTYLKSLSKETLLVK